MTGVIWTVSEGGMYDRKLGEILESVVWVSYGVYVDLKSLAYGFLRGTAKTERCIGAREGAS
jgi:hypothetical protein